MRSRAHKVNSPQSGATSWTSDSVSDSAATPTLTPITTIARSGADGTRKTRNAAPKARRYRLMTPA